MEEKVHTIKIPTALDKILFKDLEATYEIAKDYLDSEKNTLVTDSEKNRRYLGTYYPRSFAEGFHAAKKVLFLKPVTEILNGKKDIKILDVGAGPGGYSLGVIYALKKYLGFNHHISLVAIDGNKELISIHDYIHENFKNIKIELRHIDCTFSHLNLESEIVSLVNGQKFDFVVTSKFINELITEENENIDSNNLYFDFLSAASSILDEDGPGCIIINEVTYPKQGEKRLKFMPQYINMQTTQFMRLKQADFQIVYPVSCALWWKLCTNSYNCFVQKHICIDHSGLENRKYCDLEKFFYKILLFNDERLNFDYLKQKKISCLRVKPTTPEGEKSCCSFGKINMKPECTNEDCTDCYSSKLYNMEE